MTARKPRTTRTVEETTDGDVVETVETDTTEPVVYDSPEHAIAEGRRLLVERYGSKA